MSGRTFFDEDILRAKKLFLSRISVFEHLSKQTFIIAYGVYEHFSWLADGVGSTCPYHQLFLTLVSVLVKV